ncbi:unnamed protein product, partial [Closterium sp. NIES-54]
MGGFKAAAALLVLILVANEVGVSLALGESAIKGTTAGGGGTDPTAMGENATAATDLVRLYVRMGTVMLLGSLEQPRSVRFDFERCVSVPEAASASGGSGAGGGGVGGSSGGASGGGAVDALVWWDVFLGDVFFDRTVCDAVQLFASPDCSGAAAAKYQNTGYQNTGEMSAFKMDTSVKSIRCVLGGTPVRPELPCPNNLPSTLYLPHPLSSPSRPLFPSRLRLPFSPPVLHMPLLHVPSSHCCAERSCRDQPLERRASAADALESRWRGMGEGLEWQLCDGSQHLPPREARDAVTGSNFRAISAPYTARTTPGQHSYGAPGTQNAGSPFGAQSGVATIMGAVFTASEVGVALGAPAANSATAGGGSGDSADTTGASKPTIATGIRGAASVARAGSAARDTVNAELRVGSVVLAGSLAQPRSVSFDLGRCEPVPETSGGAVDALVWWDVFSDRTVCNAVQLFASPDCSGAPAAKYPFTGYMTPIKMGASVKSIRCVI